MAEADAADEEAADAHQALGPAVGLGRGLVRRAEAEEDGVARLHADEGRPGVVGDRVGEAGDEAADQQQDGRVSRRDGLREVGARLLRQAGLVFACGTVRVSIPDGAGGC